MIPLVVHAKRGTKAGPSPFFIVAWCGDEVPIQHGVPIQIEVTREGGLPIAGYSLWHPDVTCEPCKAALAAAILSGTIGDVSTEDPHFPSKLHRKAYGFNLRTFFGDE